MNLKTFIYLILFIFVFSTVGFSQSHRVKPENYFGLQFRPLIPLGMVGDRAFNIKNGEFNSEITPIFGYSYGGVVRIGITELLAIETGLNYTTRRFRVDYAVPDSNIVATENKSYVNFELPVNLLVYVKLGNRFYMNVAAGVSGNFNPSNIRSPKLINPHGKHLFLFEGRRYNHFDFNANAEVGFEYRTERAGIFYLGMAGRVPFTKVLKVATEYRYDTYSLVAYGEVTGATFSLNIRYFLHNVNAKKGIQKEKGPIDF